MRYSPEQLKEMADTVIRAEQIGDPRSVVLYMRVSQLTGLAPEVVRHKIHQMTEVPDDTQ